MNTTQTNQGQPLPLVDPEEEARQALEALRWCERLGRKMDRTRSKGKPSRGTYDSRNR